MKTSRIKRGDRVVVTCGKDKGKEGRVLSIDHKNNKVVVEGRNMIRRHMKAGQQNPQGGIIDKEAPLHISNVAYLHKGEPTRIGYQVEITTVDGKEKKVKRRIAKSTGEVID